MKMSLTQFDAQKELSLDVGYVACSYEISLLGYMYVPKLAYCMHENVINQNAQNSESN